MQRGLICLFLGAALCLLVGCDVALERPKAEAVAGQFHAALQAKQYDTAVKLCDVQFYEQNSEREFRDVLARLDTQLGGFKQAKLIGWHAEDRTLAGGPSGTFYALDFQVTYGKYPAQESLTVYRPDGSDTFAILGYHINSEGLVKE